MQSKQFGSEFDTQISTWDNMIREGKINRVREQLNKIAAKKVPRKWALDVSTLAMRTGHFNLGLKVLTPIIRPLSISQQETASADEQTMYAFLLQRIGLNREAFERFQTIDHKRSPKALLYSAFCFFNEWNYSQPIDILQEYIDKPSLSDYDRLIGEVNLLSCYVMEKRFKSAEPLFEKISEFCRQQGYQRLLGNSLELMAQLHIRLKHYEQAHSFLQMAEKSVDTNDAYYRLFIDKWQAYLEGLSKKSTAPLEKLRSRAEQLGHWETLRDLDYLSLQIQFRVDTFYKLYFGTNYPHYRHRLRQTFSNQANLPEMAYLGDSDLEELAIFDGRYQGKLFLNPGQKVHQLLCAFFFDLYAPLKLGSIYSKVFSDEEFNIYSSPNKVHQLILRGRHQLDQQNLPLMISEHKGDFNLVGLESVKIRMPLDKKIETTDEIYGRWCRQEFGEQIVGLETIQEKLEISQAKTHRFVKSGIEEGFIAKVGQGKKTRYRFLGKKKASDLAGALAYDWA